MLRLSCKYAGFIATCLAGLIVVTAKASPPTALQYQDQMVEHYAVPLTQAPPVDYYAVQEEDAAREAAGLAPRFAVANKVSITPATDGLWEKLNGDNLVWRLRVSSPDALSLNLGFSKYHMPAEGRMVIYSADMKQLLKPYTARDNSRDGELWTAIVTGDELVVEVTIPASAKDELELELANINVGYRLFGEDKNLRSGSCNVDVVCAVGDDWWDEIPAVGMYTVGGVETCTGALINNTANDQTPYFLTAYHCEVTSSNDQSVVVYWNYETSSCGGSPDGSRSDYQSGAIFRARYAASDFCLLELVEDPDPAFGLTFAGWDRSGDEASTAIAIHHPSCDEKRISFEYDPTSTTTYLQTSVPGDGTHYRITDWDVGTTEHGSSGSPLFNQDHQVIGQLHGGYAACGNDDSDWYGKISVSWNGGGSAASRLRDWLDPISSGAVTLDTLVPGADGLSVSVGGLSAVGDPGGPFTPDSATFTLENNGSSSINYTVTKAGGASWVTVSNSGGVLAGGGTTTVVVSINANANLLSDGEYSESIVFTNTTDHVGDTTRQVSLQVGGPRAVYTFPLDTDPGWTTEGQWAFGQPTGQGGSYGNPDPTSGHTGTNVYGYNLNGDYQANVTERHLTTIALDCSDVTGTTLKFWRWLGVEKNSYDHAYVRVSNNGTSWTTIWENGDDYIEDDSWTLHEFDISAYADNQSTVYIRWTMGSVDTSWQYCGWNIDDIEIWGIQAPAETCDDGILNQGESRIDCGGPCSACECVQDSNCDDGLFCSGEEFCDEYGQCVDGYAPCSSSQWCYEDEDSCNPYGDGDFDGDSDVDLQDFAEFQACFGQLGLDGCAPGNFGGTGVIDIDDYAAFETNLSSPGK